MSLVEQELLTLPEHLSSPSVFSGIRVTRSIVLYVCFVDRCLSFCTFSFDHCVVCLSLIYGFWLPLCYLLTIVLSVLWYTDSDYLPLVSSNFSSYNNPICWFYWIGKIKLALNFTHSCLQFWTYFHFKHDLYKIVRHYNYY